MRLIGIIAVSALILSGLAVGTSVPTAYAADAAWSPSDGASGQAIFRIRGALVPDGLAGSVGPGWMLGGGAGLGLSRFLLLSVNIDRFKIHDRYARSVEPWTVQLEVGTPFQRRVKPRFEVGAGLYRRIERTRFIAGPPTILGPFPFGERSQYVKDETLLGFNYGLGISAPVAKRIMAELGLHYHETLNRGITGTRSHSLVLSYVGFGMTYGLR
jgi:hypothetical protein